jgi:hypothetical protein
MQIPRAESIKKREFPIMPPVAIAEIEGGKKGSKCESVIRAIAIILSMFVEVLSPLSIILAVTTFMKFDSF